MIRLRIGLLLGLTVALLTLSGCGQSEADALLENYQWRMGNVLSAPLEPVLDSAIVTYPRRRDLQLDIPAVKINLLQFLRLSQCELQRLLGERNSNLGRLMPASQQLVYQQRFMQLAEACLSQLVASDSGHDLQQALRAAMASKREHQLALIWNATFASDEFRHLLGAANQPSSVNENMPSELVNALANLAELASNTEAANWQPIEQYLQVIGADAYAGQLLLTQRHLVQFLSPVTVVLQASVAAGSVCPQGRVTPQARILQNVFYKYYIGEVQPFIAQVYQRSQALQHPLQQIYQQLQPVVPPAFEEYWQVTWSGSAESLWQRFQQEVSAHTLAWQAQLRQCGLLPTG